MYSDYSSMYNQTALLTSMLGVIMIPALIAMAIGVIINWRIFEKAYIPGWQSIVPVLNTYRTLQIAQMPAALAFLMFIPIVGAIAIAVLLIVARYKMVKIFGGSAGMAVLSIFFSGVVMLIIAFSKKYDYMAGE